MLKEEDVAVMSKAADDGGARRDGALFGECLSAGGVGSGAKFAVDFVLVGVGQEPVEQANDGGGQAFDQL